MVSFIRDLASIWTPTEYIFWGFVVYVLILFLADIYFKYTINISRWTNQILKREDLLFANYILSVVILLAVNIKYHFLESILGITEFHNVRLELMRYFILKYSLAAIVIFTLLFPFASAYVAHKHKMQSLKWFVYGLLLNLLAFVYLLSLVRDHQKSEETKGRVSISDMS
jgi:hypothetical protein